MNFSDLKNIDVADLKNIDLIKLQSDLLKQKDVVVNGIIIFISFFIIFKFFINSQTEIKILKSKIENSEKKNTLIAQHNKALKDLNEFVANLSPGIPRSSIIDKLTDFTESRNVHILTISPTKIEENDLYERSSISLKIAVREYSDLLLFIKDIENSTFNIRIDKWGGFLADPIKEFSRKIDESKETNEVLINVQMDVSSIKFKRS